ncbi:MAG: signal peptide peptidase SppA [Verrucomicrobiota bacterium]
MSQNKSGCLPSTLTVALIISVILNVAFFAGRSVRAVRSTMQPASASPFTEDMIAPPTGDNNGKKIAVLSLRGIISTAEPGNVAESGLDDLIVELKQAREDNAVAAIILRIDSPGGEVTASDMLYQEVIKTRNIKPVVVSMDAVAASGGYYVACAGSYLFAHETSITGSIGVIMQSINYQKVLDKVGVEVLTFKSGAFKDLLNGARELTEAEREYVQGLIDQSYSRFVGIVAKERHLEESELRAGVADGRIVSGSDALKERLIDGIGGFDQALEKARELGKAPGAGAVRYTVPLAFGKLFRMLSETPVKGAKVEVDLGGKLSSRLKTGRLYFVSPVLAP